ncbi:SWI/SNF chromatin-remodeling complex subunit [Rhizophlyctis rosea]|nr:SWI/SNF chromatin-remodeling complex subunit [Rhizophlyctis rosea]
MKRKRSESASNSPSVTPERAAPPPPLLTAQTSMPALSTPQPSPSRQQDSAIPSTQASPSPSPSKPPSTTSAPASPHLKKPAGPKGDPNLSAAALEMYLQRERAHELGIKQQREMQQQFYQEKKREIDWLSQMIRVEQKAGADEGLEFEIVYPKKRKRQTREIVFTEEEMESVADQKEVLIPIRLDLEVDGVKLRDTFTWNLNDHLVQPEQFAEILCEDLHLPVASFLTPIAKSIREQVDDYLAPKALEPGERDAEGNNGEDDGSRDAPELRVVIKLDITIGNYCLVDQFEWDLNCKRNNPELFAEHMTAELNLCSEFRTAIAHSIREQVQTYAKSLLLVDHQFDGSPVDDDELEQCFLPPVEPSAVLRQPKQVALFMPYYNPVTDMEIERMEKDRDRDNRRKRRQTQRSRRIVNLPDRESIKTSRTGVLVLAPGGVKEDVPPHTPAAGMTRRSQAGGSGTGVRGPGRRGRPPAAAAAAAGLHAPDGVGGGHGAPGRDREMVLSATREKPLVKPAANVPADWRCKNCKRTAQDTPLLRKGPEGDKTLCNACGLFWLKNSYSRPVSPVPSSSIPNSPSPAHYPPLTHGGKPDHGRSQSISGGGETGMYQEQPTSYYRQFPPWVDEQRRSLMARYPNDRFEVVTKGPGGPMRIKCLDCPGKLYQPGPDETLGNFEVHLRNRTHRATVNARAGLVVRRSNGSVNGEEGGSAGAGAGGVWGDGGGGHMQQHQQTHLPSPVMNGGKAPAARFKALRLEPEPCHSNLINQMQILAFLDAVSFLLAGNDVVAAAAHLAPPHPVLYLASNNDEELQISADKLMHRYHQAKMTKPNPGRQEILETSTIHQGQLGNIVGDAAGLAAAWADIRDGYVHVASLHDHIDEDDKDIILTSCAAAFDFHSDKNMFKPFAKIMPDQTSPQALSLPSVRKVGIRSWEVVAAEHGANNDQIHLLAQSASNYPLVPTVGTLTVKVPLHAELAVVEEVLRKHPDTKQLVVGVSKDSCFSCYYALSQLRKKGVEVNVRDGKPCWMENEEGELEPELEAFWQKKLKAIKPRASPLHARNSEFSHLAQIHSEQSDADEQAEELQEAIREIAAGRRRKV